MKITVERDIHKDEMLIALRLPLSLLNFDNEARDRLDYLMLRVATSPVDSNAGKLVEALLHVVEKLRQKDELDRAALQKMYTNQMAQGHGGQSGLNNSKLLQSTLGAYASGGAVAPNNPPPKPDVYNRIMKSLKDKT